MRISYIPSRSANSIHVMKMCHAFAMNGHDVVLFVRMIQRKLTKENDIFSYYGDCNSENYIAN